MARIAALLLFTLLISGCQLFPKFKAPQLTVVNAQVVRGDLWRQRIKLRLRVHNPNDRTLPVKGIKYTIDLDNQPFADGETVTSFVVPAGGEAEFDTTVNVDLASTVLRYLGHGSESSIEYHIKGKVSLSSWFWRSIHFDEQGFFNLQGAKAQGRKDKGEGAKSSSSAYSSTTER